MSAPAVLSQPPALRVENKAATAPAPPQKAAPGSRPSVYWGDRLTIRFWLLCFGLMMGINVVEAVHNFVVYLIRS